MVVMEIQADQVGLLFTIQCCLKYDPSCFLRKGIFMCSVVSKSPECQSASESSTNEHISEK